MIFLQYAMRIYVRTFLLKFPKWINKYTIFFCIEKIQEQGV